MDSLLINQKTITPDNLREYRARDFTPLSEQAAREVLTFLAEWWNSEAYITVQTSGSTGTPKSIRLLKESVISSAKNTIDFFKITSNSNLLLCLPCRYIAGKLMLVRAIVSGAAIVAVEPNLNPLAQLAAHVDFAAMIPAQVSQSLLDDSQKNKLRAIPAVLLGGGPVSTELEGLLEPLKNRFYHSYGMTETATHVALREINRETDYTALKGIRFSLDERDCLHIEADYFPEAIQTNDLVELRDEHRFHWLGRFDHAIISGGIKHIPEVLEKVLSAHIHAPFFVYGESHKTLGQQLVLVVESESWAANQIDELKVFLTQHLARHSHPARVYFSREFARTETGKVKREETVRSATGTITL